MNAYKRLVMPLDFIPSLQELSFFALYEHVALQSGAPTLAEILRHMIDHSAVCASIFHLHPEQGPQERLAAFVQAALIDHGEEDLVRRCITWLLDPVGAHIMEQIMRLDLLEKTVISDLMQTDRFSASMLASFLEMPPLKTDTPDAADLPLFHLLKTTWGRAQIRRLSSSTTATRTTEPSDLDRWLMPLMDPRLLNATVQSGIEQGSSLIFYLMLGVSTDLPFRRHDPSQADTIDYFTTCSALLKDLQDPEADQADHAWLGHITHTSLYAFALFGIDTRKSLFSFLMELSDRHLLNRGSSLAPPTSTLFSRWRADQPHLNADLYGSTPLELLHFFSASLRGNRLLHDFYNARFSADEYHLLRQIDQNFLRKHLPFFIAHPTLFTLYHHHLLKCLPDDLSLALLATHVCAYLEPKAQAHDQMGHIALNASHLITNHLPWVPEKLWHIDRSELKANVGYILRLDAAQVIRTLSSPLDALSDLWACVCQPQITYHQDFFKQLNTIIHINPSIAASLSLYTKNKIKNKATKMTRLTLISSLQGLAVSEVIVASFNELDIFFEVLLAPFISPLDCVVIPESGEAMAVPFGMYAARSKNERIPDVVPQETIQHIDPHSHQTFVSYLGYFLDEMDENQLSAVAIRLMMHPQLRCCFEHADYRLLRTIPPQSWHKILRYAVAHVFLELFSLDDHRVIKTLLPETVASLFIQLYEHPEVEQIFFLDDAYLLRTHAQKIFDTLAEILATPSRHDCPYFTQQASHWLAAHDAALFKHLKLDTSLASLLPIVLDAWDACPPWIQKTLAQLLDRVDKYTLATLIPSLTQEEQLRRLLSLNGHRLCSLLESHFLNTPLMRNAFKGSKLYRTFILKDPSLWSQLNPCTLIADLSPFALRGDPLEKKCLAELLSRQPLLFLELSLETQQSFYQSYLDNTTEAAVLEALWCPKEYILLHQFQFSWLRFGQLARIPKACWALDDGYLWRQCTQAQWGELLLFSGPTQRARLLSQYDPSTVISHAQLESGFKTKGAQWLPLLREAPSLLTQIDEALILAIPKLCRRQLAHYTPFSSQNWLDLLSLSGHSLLHRIPPETLLRVFPRHTDALSALLEMDDGYLLKHPYAYLEPCLRHADACRCEAPPTLLAHPQIYYHLNARLVNLYFLSIPLSILEHNDHHLMRCLTASSLHQSLHDILEAERPGAVKNLKKIIQIISSKYSYPLRLTEATPQNTAPLPLSSSGSNDELRSLLSVIFEYMHHPRSQSVQPWAYEHDAQYALLEACDTLVPLDPEFWSTQVRHLGTQSLSFFNSYDEESRRRRNDLNELYLRLLAAAEGLLAKQASAHLKNLSSWFSMLKRFGPDRVLRDLLTGGSYEVLRRSFGSDQWFDLVDLLFQHDDLFEVTVLEDVLLMHNHLLLNTIAYDPITVERILSHPECERFLNLEGGRLRHALLNPPLDPLCSTRVAPSLSFFGAKDETEDPAHHHFVHPAPHELPPTGGVTRF